MTGAERHEEQRLVPLSALQHYSYCPRQCALIHLEQGFDENVSTLRGRAVHRLVDQENSIFNHGVRTEHGLPLYSDRHGLIGKADTVEFLHDGTPYPVEYKHGKRHAQQHDDIQLTAQAICLEEMTGKEIAKGAIYHHRSHRRREVSFTAKLRQQTLHTAEKVRVLLDGEQMPPPTKEHSRCRNCSLMELCQPEWISGQAHYHQLYADLYSMNDE